ncbi:UNVERIFIED_CONTAM: Glucan endo-1,3-beta-glucosidase 12 [Sesamum latifolium]|uniref:Glucan endo-1,3-beta-glucosidase 12 n=1 Tax=Sesamum latifolium TaxID=2727402 RepID=A0AAW2X8K7_9LAMI
MFNCADILFLCSSPTAATGQESVGFLALHDSTVTLQSSSQNGLPVAVQVETEHLKNVANSVLMAETWLRNHVLAHYPATNVTTIVVGHSLLCSKDQEDKLGLVLPSVKNIHYSLTRWGLQNDIKVAASFSSGCLDSKSQESYRVDVAEAYIKPLLSVLQDINSPYVVNPPSYIHTLSDETLSLLKSHSKSMKNLGVLHLNRINVVISAPRREKPSSRKLSSIDLDKMIDPFPPRPTPISPSHSPSRSSSPAYAARSPLPPLVGIVSPAPSLPPLVNPISPPFLPPLAPMANPASPPFGPHLPPCTPSEGGGSAGAPVGVGVHNGLWCVAKPSVPAETLQEALDYACGEGEADCDAIRPEGSCYFPDSLVAHASYAFNSYWQKTKRNGGTCGFGGTAMLINSDPICSFEYQYRDRA